METKVPQCTVFEVDKRTLGGKKRNGSMCSIKYKGDDERHYSLAVKRFSLYFQSCAELKPFWVSHLIDVTDPLVMKRWGRHYVCNSCAASHKHFPIDLQRARSLLSNLPGLRMIVVCSELYRVWSKTEKPDDNSIRTTDTMPIVSTDNSINSLYDVTKINFLKRRVTDNERWYNEMNHFMHHQYIL